MKTLFYTLLFIGLSSTAIAQVGIGTSAPQGALDIVTTAIGGHNGLLIPRVPLTIGPTNALPLVAPTVSEMIYNTSTVGGATPGFYYWNGTSWVRFATGASTGWLTTGNAGLTAGTNFIGTTDAVDVSFKRGSVLSGYIGATSTAFGVGAIPSGAATNSTAFGNNALSVSTGANNVALGQNALRDCAGSAIYNTAVGTNALKGINNAASQYNTVLGGEAMGLTTGDVSNCTAVGYQALNSISGAGAARGLNNTALGYQAGSTITTGENNIAIGYQAQVPGITSNNQIQIGNSAISLARCQVAWTLSSDQRFKNNIKDSELGLQFLQTLRPVSYLRSNDAQAKTEYGFIAQEIEAAFSKAGYPNNGVISKDDSGFMGVRYNDFISISVKAIQEQQQQIETLQLSNAELQKTNAAILERLAKLERK